MASAMYLSQAADYRNPLIWVYVAIFGALPGLIVGGVLGALAGMRSDRGGAPASSSASAIVGALAATTATALILTSLTSRSLLPTPSMLWGAASLSAIPGAVAGLIWWLGSSGRGTAAVRTGRIAAAVLIGVAAQLTVYANMDYEADVSPPIAYPGP